MKINFLRALSGQIHIMFPLLRVKLFDGVAEHGSWHFGGVQVEELEELPTGTVFAGPEKAH